MSKAIDWPKLMSGVHDYLARAFAPVNARVKALEDRVIAMEKSVAEFTYKGVWETGTAYWRNNSVTMNGSLWICRAETSMQRPGDGPDWRLAVKHGRDART